ncbi:alpha/beta hydrolase [Stenotrophomonas sp.]|jgi:pimeloyl-ACP methyl ester carboxylesterase|uniref:alpha/beta fold hydrolase n=1 Tax=Stenotrophomonas sp. TaxID=69392 RepID=UPI003340EFE4
MTLSSTLPESRHGFENAPTRSLEVDGTRFAYRGLGPRHGIPLVMLNHWGAVLDNFDPRIVDGLASSHRVIAIDYRGIGGSGGKAPVSVAEMAQDTIALIRAMGLGRIDLLGFSLGGFVAQQVALDAPDLVRRLILTGSGPAGGRGIDRVGRVSWPLILKGLLTRRDPKYYLFFTASARSRQAANDFLQRLQERRNDRDRPASPTAFLRQLKAITAWGRQPPQDLGQIPIPVLVANGDSDIMVPTPNRGDLAHRLPNATLVIYDDAGHGGIFQYHTEFVRDALASLDN